MIDNRRRPRILFIDPGTGLGGAERCLVTLVDQLKASMNIRVIALGDSDKLQNELHTKGIWCKTYPYFELNPRQNPLRFFQKLGLYSIYLMRICGQALRFKPGLIHIWGIAAWELAFPLRILFRLPIIGTCHDQIQASPVSARRRKLIAWSSQYLNRCCCVSEACRKELVASGVSEIKTFVTHTGVSSQKPKAAGSTYRNFIHVGNISPEKGQHFVIEAAGLLQQHQEHDFRITFLGCAAEKDREYEQRIKQEVKSCNLAEKIFFEGWTSNVLDHMRISDLLLFTSPRFDSFPTVLLEAISANLPILAFRTGGVAEIVENDENGWVLQANTSQELAEKLRELITTGKQPRYSKPLRFTLAAFVEDHRRMYDQLLTSRVR